MLELSCKFLCGLTSLPNILKTALAGNGAGTGPKREGLDLCTGRIARTGIHTSKPTQIGAQKNPKGLRHIPDREKTRPGASSHGTAQHARIRPTARRDRHRLHHRGRERNRRETDTFNDKQSQIAERKTGGGRGPGDRSKEAV